MYPLYRDIRERLGTPKWTDMHGVPRYSDFNPKEAADIYGTCVALMEVKCQACGKIFKCANSSYIMSFGIGFMTSEQILKYEEDPLHYTMGWGDAPWHDFEGNEDKFDSQCAGTTMSTDYRLVEYWLRNKDWEMKEIPEKYKDWETPEF